MSSRSVLVVGNLEASRLLCTLLADEGCSVQHLPDADESALAKALTDEIVGVAIVVRGDLLALRVALLVEHLRPGVPMVVTIFDRTLGQHLAEVVPRCIVTSPADVAAPAVVAACIQPAALAVLPGPNGVQHLVDSPDGVVLEPAPPRVAAADAWSQWLENWIPRRNGGSEGILLFGLFGLVLTIGVEWLLALTVLHEGPVAAFYSSARLVATVGPAEAEIHGAPGWYLAVSAILMLAGIALTGALVAGLVEWMLGPRSAGIIGPRSVPRRDHVVIAGLGQVGLRVAQLLRSLHVPVVVVERTAHAPNLDVARASKIPVVIGDASSRAVLQQLRTPQARAIAAMGSQDLDNIAVVINALAVSPTVGTVLRAGENAAVNETTSLFKIGHVTDVGVMTAAWVCASLRGRSPRAVWTAAHHVGVLDSQGDHRRAVPQHCACIS